MEAVKKAKSRLKSFPLLLSDCSKEGAAYASCVTKTDDPKQAQCDREFANFKSCLVSAAKRRSVKI